MKNIIPSLGLIIAALAAASCACKITPPPTRLYSNTELSGKVAAELEQLHANGELSGNWKNTVDRQFAALNDDNAAYFMLLEAIQCESRRGNKALAQQMFRTLDRELAERRPARLRTARTASSHLPPEVEVKRAETVLSLH